MDPQNVNQLNDGSALDPSAPQGPEGQGAPQIDPAEYQRMQERAAAAERAAQQAQMQANQLAAAQAQAAYEANRKKAIEEAREKDDPTILSNFYEQERQQERQQIQSGMAQMLVGGYRQKLQQDYGLRPDQVHMLGEDPNQMESRAQYLHQQNQQAQQFQESLNQAFVGQQAHDRVMSNADRIGGARGGAGRAEPTYEKGSMDHLHDLYYGEAQVIIP
jgi:hypothetical protein